MHFQNLEKLILHHSYNHDMNSALMWIKQEANQILEVLLMTSFHMFLRTNK